MLYETSVRIKGRETLGPSCTAKEQNAREESKYQEQKTMKEAN